MALNRFFIIITLSIFLIATNCFLPGAYAQGTEKWISVIPTEAAGNHIKKSGSPEDAFVMIGESTILVSGASLAKDLHRSHPQIESQQFEPGEIALLMTTKDPDMREIDFPGVRVIYSGYGFRVLLATELAYAGLAKYVSDFTSIEPLPRNQVLLTLPRSPERGAQKDARIEALINKIDMAAYKKDLKALSHIKTRYTYAPEAEDAISYAETALQSLGLETRRLPFNSASKPSYNVEALIKGTDSATHGEVIILGHLDCVSESSSRLAPGADDNGSGAAAVIALARLATKNGLKFKADVRFLLLMGEEQGLLGSKAYVAGLSAAELKKIRTGLNLDMIGFDVRPPLSIILETSAFNKDMASRFADYAASYTQLSTQVSLRPFGSDHMPFLNRRVPCLLAIESEYDSNPHYHRTSDTFDIINFDMVKEILRMSAVIMLKDAGI